MQTQSRSPKGAQTYKAPVNKTYKGIKTTVERIIYFNQASKWGVLLLKNKINDALFFEPSFIAVGNFDGVYVNCVVELDGKYIVSKNYGGQLEITNIKVVQDLSSAESVINFLVKSGIKGISTQNARKIYETFGTNSIDVVLNEPEKLSVIYGIGDETCKKVIESVKDYKRMQELIEYGCKIGMPYNLLFKLNQVLGDRALEALKSNIYRIVELSEAFSFKQLDTIGQKAGIDPTDIHRLRACLIDRIRNKVMLDGCTGCETNEVRQDFAKASGLAELKYYNVAVAVLKKENFLIIEGSKVYYKPYYNKEAYIAKVLSDLMEVPLNNKSIPDLLLVGEAIASFPFTLNRQQIDAIEGIIKERVAVLTGGPGTGKTTITQALVQAFGKAKIPYVLLAPTGKAARRLSECAKAPAQTIHKFLGVHTNIEEAATKVVTKDTVFIIDESSMVDIMMLAKLVETALQTPVRFIFVGDSDQLPSVQAGNVLGDLLSSNKVPTFKLTDIMRQSQDSHIVKYCNDINHGQIIKQCNYPDFIYTIYEDDSELINDLLENYEKEVNKYGLMNVQVIAPFKEGVLGIKALNNELSNYVNQNNINDNFGYKRGDKVMQLINDYEKDVFNGETGVVECFDSDNMYVQFSTSNNKDTTEPLTRYTTDELASLQMAYASTCHKSQGAEYPVVFVVLEDKYKGLLLNRKLVYTAISRGKKKVYVYSMGRTLEHCITNTYERPRITKLHSFLVEGR